MQRVLTAVLLSLAAASLWTAPCAGQVADPVAAEKEFAQAIRIQPDLASAHYNLGLALKQQGKTNEARTYFENAEQLKRGETLRNP